MTELRGTWDGMHKGQNLDTITSRMDVRLQKLMDQLEVAHSENEHNWTHPLYSEPHYLASVVDMVSEAFDCNTTVRDLQRTVKKLQADLESTFHHDFTWPAWSKYLEGLVLAPNCA